MKQTKATYEALIQNCKIFMANERRQRYYTWAFKAAVGAYGQGQAERIDIASVTSAVMILEYSWNELFYRDGLADPVTVTSVRSK
jgi:hypothetical protein